MNTTDALGTALLDTKAAAQFLGLSYSTLSKLRLSGDGPPFLKLGNRVLYARPDIEAWVLSRRCRSTSEYYENL